MEYLNSPNEILSRQQQSLQLSFTLLSIPPAIQQTPNRIVLFWWTPQRHNTFFQSSWLEVFTLWLAVLIRFTKPVIGLSKYVMGAAIKNTGHPGRLFLAASPLCVFAFKLLKPPSYAGYWRLKNISCNRSEPKQHINTRQIRGVKLDESTCRYKQRKSCRAVTS